MKTYFIGVRSSYDKKVLLRERRRHTDHGISSTTQWGTPCWGTPLARFDGGYPRWGTPIGVPPLARSDRGVPPSQVQLEGGCPRWGTPCQGTPPWVPLVGVPPQPGLTGGTRGGAPPSQGKPPPGPGWGTPLAGPSWGTPHPPGWTWPLYPPPPRCGQTERWMDGQTNNVTPLILDLIHASLDLIIIIRNIRKCQNFSLMRKDLW